VQQRDVLVESGFCLFKLRCRKLRSLNGLGRVLRLCRWKVHFWLWFGFVLGVLELCARSLLYRRFCCLCRLRFRFLLKSIRINCMLAVFIRRLRVDIWIDWLHVVYGWNVPAVFYECELLYLQRWPILERGGQRLHILCGWAVPVEPWFISLLEMCCWDILRNDWCSGFPTLCQLPCGLFFYRRRLVLLFVPTGNVLFFPIECVPRLCSWKLPIPRRLRNLQSVLGRPVLVKWLAKLFQLFTWKLRRCGVCFLQPLRRQYELRFVGSIVVYLVCFRNVLKLGREFLFEIVPSRQL
jgi:hypothetical protein